MTEMYSFKDVKIGFMEPFLQKNSEVAKRTFETTLTTEKNILSSYKNDIELWKIATFNENTGEIEPDLKYIIGGKDINN